MIYYRKNPAVIRREMLHNALSVLLFGALVFGMMRLFASCSEESVAGLAGRDLRSFSTRRSSDLACKAVGGGSGDAFPAGRRYVRGSSHGG